MIAASTGRATLAACLFLSVSTSAWSHVGLSNLTTGITAGGQSAFAIAGTTNEIAFAIPHGCTAAESRRVDNASATFVGTSPSGNLDTHKVTITVPAAVVTATGASSLRPAMSGLFGVVARSTDIDGNVTFTWTRQAGLSGPGDDDQLYKLSVRMKLPSAVGSAIRKLQFITRQYCKDSGNNDWVMDWGTANSPTLLAFPDKRRGFNSYTLDASTVGDFTSAGTGTLAARLKAYFGDAAIVWVGKAGYSANAITQARVTALIAKDSSYSDLGATAGKSLTANDTIWVRY